MKRGGRVIEMTWTGELPIHLLGLAAGYRAARRALPAAQIGETELQGMAHQALTAMVPAVDLRTREFSIAKVLGFAGWADLALFKPWMAEGSSAARRLFTIVEMKRTSDRAKRPDLVLDDLVRLAIVARRYHLSTYFLLYGSDTEVEALLSIPVLACALLQSSPSAVTSPVQAWKNQIDRKYLQAIKSAGLTEVITTLAVNEPMLPNRCLLWRVTSQASEPSRDRLRYRITAR